jgi:choice-of-anchor B domain-containing protein
VKLRILLATAVALIAMSGTAAAHPLPGGFGFGLSVGWLDPDEKKLRDFAAAAAASKSTAPETFAPCVRGSAAGYPCENVDLLSHLPLSAIGGGEIGNDMWGWRDPQTGREYALVGKTNGTAFVDVTDPLRPEFVGHLPTQADGPRRFWRDIKVYENHAFVVSEHIGHGMQVFDLTRLRDVQDAPETFAADVVYTEISNTHNIAINEDTGFAYLVGTNTCNGGPHMVDIREPQQPEFAGCFAGDGYTHDIQCEIYDGPDDRFSGREICFASNEDTVTIVDVTDKANPVQLSRTGYPTASYTHQGWLTPDRKWFVFNDELDELDGEVARQTTYIMNVESLTSPGEVMASENNTTSTDHNLYIKNRYIYESNYTSGLRVFDGRTIASGDLKEVAWLDVYPENDNPGFEGGTWSNYPWYKGGVVGVSSIDRGLFLLRPRVGNR